jgi:translation initiation factor IF-2
MGVKATINHSIDKDTAEYIVKEFGHVPILEEAPNTILSKGLSESGHKEESRPPIVTIMGHVDH